MKMKDLNAIDIDGAMKQVEGTARNMGIAVEGSGQSPWQPWRPAGWEGGRCRPPRPPGRKPCTSTASDTASKRPRSTRPRAIPCATAIALARATSYAKFNATMEVHMHLGVDPKHADQNVRDVVVLPHGLGKVVRVLVFADGEGGPHRPGSRRGCHRR